MGTSDTLSGPELDRFLGDLVHITVANNVKERLGYTFIAGALAAMRKEEKQPVQNHHAYSPKDRWPTIYDRTPWLNGDDVGDVDDKSFITIKDVNNALCLETKRARQNTSTWDEYNLNGLERDVRGRFQQLIRSDGVQDKPLKKSQIPHEKQTNLDKFIASIVDISAHPHIIFGQEYESLSYAFIAGALAVIGKEKGKITKEDIAKAVRLEEKRAGGYGVGAIESDIKNKFHEIFALSTSEKEEDTEIRESVIPDDPEFWSAIVEDDLSMEAMITRPKGITRPGKRQLSKRFLSRRPSRNPINR